MATRKRSKSQNKSTVQLKFVKPKELQASLEKAIPAMPIAISAAVLSLMTVLSAWIAQRYLPPEIPLLYGLPEGEGQLTASIGLIIPGLVSLAALIINLTIAFFAEDKFVKQALVVASLVISMFAATTTVKVLFLVGSF